MRKNYSDYTSTYLHVPIQEDSNEEKPSFSENVFWKIDGFLEDIKFGPVVIIVTVLYFLGHIIKMAF